MSGEAAIGRGTTPLKPSGGGGSAVPTIEAP
jgi:hypothetical protein